MPVTIYPTNLKYKNSNGQFQSATAIKGDSGKAITVQVEGSTPTIVCEDNHRYICEEVLSLNITPPADGVCEIIFESGSTATLLTTPNTIKWPEWFNPNSLETSATYQFKISNRLANVAIWPDEGLTGDTRVRIQKMLGIYEAPWELIREDTFTNETEADYTLSVDALGQPFELTDLILYLWLPTQSENAGVGDYGRVYLYNDASVISTAYLNAITPAPVTTTKMAVVRNVQDNGLNTIDYIEWVSRAGHQAMKKTTYWETANVSPFIINSKPVTSILIKKVTGTMGYRILGKRKWN